MANGETAAHWRKWLEKAASASAVFYILPWLMVLLVAGTVAQKDLGLYTAQKLFFSSWVLWLGPVPLPGAYTTLLILSACLLIKFLFFSPWRGHQSGILISHLGVIILMCGGLLTAVTQKEGFLLVKEGQSVAEVSDYHARILSVSKDRQDFASIPFEDIAKGEKLVIPDIPFSVHVLDTCLNCAPAGVDDARNRKGLAAQIRLLSAPPEKEHESNLAGTTLAISGLTDDQNGIYVTMEEIPHRIKINAQGADYEIRIQRKKTVLPFAIRLVDFDQEFYPGTNMARGYSSDVVVEDGDINWPYHIRMNEPLRYKGFTLYQSSFSIRPDGEYSIFSVVENKGRIFPYIASLILFTGLIIHLIIRIRNVKSPE